LDYYYRIIMPDKIRLQKEYLRRQSALGDLRILCRTLAACCRIEVTFSDAMPCEAPDAMPAVAEGVRTQAMEVYANQWKAVAPRRAAPLLDNAPFPEFPACLGDSAQPRKWEMDAR
jgi:hypothetical protein